MDKYKYAEIYVEYENGGIAGIFTNDNSVQGNKDKLDLLNSPVVHYIMNGDCTLSFSILSQSQKWNDVKDPTNLWHCDGRIFTMLNSNSVQDDGDIINVVLHEIWNLLAKDYVQVHNVDTEVEALDIHTVKILPRTDPSKYKLTVNGTKYDDNVVKDNRGVLLPRGSGGYALWGMLKGNRHGWTLGYCDLIADNFDVTKDLGTFNLESDQTDILTNIQHIQALWGGVIVWDSKSKLVHYYDETKVNSKFNEWTGFTVFEGKNLNEKPQINIDNNIITRAFVLGNGDIHIKKVNDDKEYIENFSFTDTIYEGYIRNDNIHYTGSNLSGQTQLKEWGIRELEKLCKPRVTYLFNILDRSLESEFQHEKANICDVIKLYFKDQSTNKIIELEQRIVDLEKEVFSDKMTVLVNDKNLNNREIYEMIYENDDSGLNPDWNGNINGEDVYLDLDDFIKDFLGTEGNDMSLSFFSKEYIKLFVQHQEETEDLFLESTAGIELVADNLNAHISIFTTFTKETDEKFVQTSANINLVSNELNSHIGIYTDFVSSTGDNFTKVNTSITSTSSQLEAQIKLEASHYSQNRSDILDINGDLIDIRRDIISTNASITTTANKLQAEINLKASYDSVENSVSSAINIFANDVGGLISAEVSNKFGNGFLAVTNNSAIIGAKSNTYASVEVSSTRVVIRSDSYGGIMLSTQGSISINGTGGVSITGYAVSILGRTAQWIRLADGTTVLGA